MEKDCIECACISVVSILVVNNSFATCVIYCCNYFSMTIYFA